MESIDPLRAVSLCILLASAETLHGIVRTVVLAPIVGKARAVKLSIVSGSSLAFVLCYFFVPDVGARGVVQHLALGAVLCLFMAAFDVCIGRRVMRFAWARIWRDFDPRSGNYLSVGLFLLAFFPGLVWWLRGNHGG